MSGANIIKKTFTIKNTGSATLNLTGNPLVQISGSSYFTITDQPASSVSESNQTIFKVEFDPPDTGSGSPSAEIIIVNNDSNEDPYNINISGSWTNSTTLPTVISFSINNGTPSTSSRNVTLNNSCSGSPTDYIASESSSFSGASWQTYSSAPSFTLSSGNGTKTIYFKVKNSAGESTRKENTITLSESITPTVNSFSINNGASSTSSRNVILNNSCSGSPTDYIASENSSFSGASWQTYSSAPSFTLSSAGYGEKTVYFKVMNSAGESAIKNDAITLDEANGDNFGYVIRLYWVGDPVVNDMDLILRNPKDANSVYDYAPLDCYYGRPNPDWGITGYELDDPIWYSVSYGATNIEQIFAHELLDIGTFTIIARAHTGSAKCWIEIETWNFENIGYFDEKLLTANNSYFETRYLQQGKYQDMNIRALKFKQNKRTGKYIFKITQNNLPSELPINEFVRIYLNNDGVFADNGTHWIQSASGKKYTIGKPWSMKVLLNSKNAIYVRGYANTIYKSANVDCNVFIGEYLGTNAFRTDEKCKYKYKKIKR